MALLPNRVSDRVAFFLRYLIQNHLHLFPIERTRVVRGLRRPAPKRNDRAKECRLPGCADLETRAQASML